MSDEDLIKKVDKEVKDAIAEEAKNDITSK